MIIGFFEDKFDYDFESNLRWCKVLIEHEEYLNPYIRSTFSHIINVHHIWISRLIGTPSESHSTDVLPVDYWLKFCEENHRKSIDFILKNDLEQKIHYHNEEGVQFTKETIDVLYHILNHSNYHRGQIARELRRLEIEPPIFNFISYHSSND